MQSTFALSPTAVLIVGAIFLGSLFIGSLSAEAQEVSQAPTRYEVEERVAFSEVPKPAKAWIEGIQKELPWKWYVERGENSLTYEAKAGWQGYYFSAEFDDAGVFQDLELQVKWRKIPEPIRASMGAVWENEFKKWKLEKVQLQLSDWPETCWWKERNAGSFYESLYEVELSSRDHGVWKHWVLLHRPDGTVVSRYQKIPPPTLFIDY